MLNLVALAPRLLSPALVLLVLLVFNVNAASYPHNYDSEGPGISHSLIKACPVADGFDFPVGPPHARGYYNAQKFGRNSHLGDDWNGLGGGNSDLGDPIYSIAHGIVVFIGRERGSWGKVIRILHNRGTPTNPIYVESVYAHLKTVLVKKGEPVRRGQTIATLGNAEGVFLAHLHLEIRTVINKPIGYGYSKQIDGYTDPTQFIKSHRPYRKKQKRVVQQ